MVLSVFNFTSRHCRDDSDASRAVPRLHVAGRKQGNLGWLLFFEIGEQRDERYIIEQRCRLELATATFRGDGNCGGEQRTACCGVAANGRVTSAPAGGLAGIEGR
ncbi:hypothetical protein uvFWCGRAMDCOMC449_027 [Freshwater phage uvFW-CGR-AMD-COM-C449]|nr:hypothetical protein uvFWCGRAMDCOMC449_027 [Freshwater phage uvFW-CGR-AMD-COM-C449]